MNTLIYTSCLGLFCLIAEILNLRKLLIPVILIGLAGIFYVNSTYWGNTSDVSIYGIDIAHMLRIDNFAVAFSALALFLMGLIFVMSADYYKNEPHRLSDYLAILVFILCGTLVLFSYQNMAMLFLGIEIVSISLYVMAGSLRFSVRSNEAGFKYFLMGSFATGFLLFGIALVYGASGSFVLNHIMQYAASSTVSPLFYVGMLLIVMAMLFKVAAVPFHFWSPDVYEGSPALVTALMSTLVKIGMFGAFYRLMNNGFIYTFGYAQTILVIVCVATIIIGNIVALSQQNFKRLLAYSGISHAGYMFLAILSLRTDSSSALFFYGTTYSLASIGAFAIAIPVFSAMKSENIEAFNGLGKKHPVLAALLTMMMLSLAGIPPFAGFIGKYNIFSEAFQNGYFTLTVIAIINSIIGIYYYTKVILAMYTKPANETPVSPSLVYWIVIGICAALSLLLGVLPNVLIGLLHH